jgi:multiple sugar transport system substrate-binding protein
MTTKITRRKLLKLAGGTSVAGLLAACATPAAPSAPTAPAAPQAEAPAAPAPTDAPAAEGAVTVSFMGWGAPEEDEGVKAAIKQFESEQSAVKVEWQHTPEQYGEKFLANVAAGTPPDTAFIGSDVFRTYARDGLLLDITNNIKGDSLLGKPDYFIEPQEEGRCTYNGAWYGIGSCWVAPHVYYNADRLKEAGVELPSNDPEKAWDWDTFVSNAKKLTIDKNGKNATESGFDADNIDKFGVSWPNWSLPLHSAILTNGGDWIDPQTGLLILDKPEATEAIQKVFDLFLTEKVMPNDKTTQELGMSVAQMLENGKLAMAIDGSWALSWLYKIKAPLGTAVLPKIKVPGTSAQAHLHSALKATKSPDAAWQWVRFLSTPFYQTQFCKIGLWLPSQTALMTAEGLKTWITPGVHPDGYVDIVTKFVPQHGRVLYMPPGWPKVDKVLAPAFDKIRNGDATAIDAMKAAVPEANAILAEEAKKG